MEKIPENKFAAECNRCGYISWISDDKVFSTLKERIKELEKENERLRNLMYGEQTKHS